LFGLVHGSESFTDQVFKLEDVEADLRGEGDMEVLTLVKENKVLQVNQFFFRLKVKQDADSLPGDADSLDLSLV